MNLLSLEKAICYNKNKSKWKMADLYADVRLSACNPAKWR